MGFILKDELILGVEEVAEWRLASGFAHENNPRSDAVKLFGKGGVGEIGGPKAFEGDNGQARRHGDVRVKRIYGIVGEHEFGERLIAGDFGEKE